ncbi:MAG TPA: amidohydrolase family protein [candidate division Zixibacteria bacterium]|nr:amidohydrolase family protein [candidate division Zixibacteria bacterium]
MSSLLLKNVGTLVTGDLQRPLRAADSIYIERGVIAEIGNGIERAADRVIDARGITVIPGLVDSHSHPSIGEYTPAQNSLGWITNYMHGGVTSLISAGELHLPGLPLPPDARTALSLALVTKRCYDALRPSGVKVFAGTLLLVPGLREADFDEIRAAGIKLVKFIFYDYSLLPDGEAERYVRWARERGIKVKIHSGGVSRSGVSQIAGFDIVRRLRPDIIGHITGGPIPMSEDDMLRIAEETDCAMEICTSGNYRLALVLARAVRSRGLHHRVLIGTDTPGGTGIVPRAMLREIAFLSSVGEIEPEKAICMATGNVGRAHDLNVGIIEEGRPADVVLLHKITGSVARDALDSFSKGDLPGISHVIIDGVVRVSGRSQQTPPPERSASELGEGGNPRERS